MMTVLIAMSEDLSRDERERLRSCAVAAVARAIRRGELASLSKTVVACVDGCGRRARQYDHRSYYEPLAVEPVCASCNQRRGPALPCATTPEEFERSLIARYGVASVPWGVRGRAVAAHELEALTRAAGALAQNAICRARDLALLAVLSTAGCGRAEVIALDVDVVRTLPAEAQGPLTDWLAVRGGARGPLFTTIHKGGHVTALRLDYWRVGDLLRRWSRAAGVPLVTTNDLRRSALCRRTQLGGMKSPTTTNEVHA